MEPRRLPTVNEHGHGTQEEGGDRKRRSPPRHRARSSSRVNALSYFMYKRNDTTKTRALHALQGQRAPAPVDEAEHAGRRLRHEGLPKLDAFVRDLRDLLKEYKDASGGKFEYTIIEAEGRRARRRRPRRPASRSAVRRRRATPRTRPRSPRATWASSSSTAREKDAIPFLSPDNATGLEFWITNKIREVRDKGDNIKHKIGVLTGQDEMKLTRARTSSRRSGQKPDDPGRSSPRTSRSTDRGRRPEGRRQPRSTRSSTASSSPSPARTSPRRSSAASTSS